MSAHRGLIYLSFLSGRTEDGWKQWQRAAQFARADNVNALLTRAMAYLWSPFPERAAPAYRRVLELDPINEEAPFFSVTGLWWFVDPARAVVDGRDYLERFGENDEVRIFVAYAHYALGEPGLAFENIEVAIDRSIQAMVAGGIMLDRMGQPERAAEVWRRGVELLEPGRRDHPDNAKVRFYLACFYGLLGDRARSVSEKEAAIALDVNDWAALHLAVVHAHLGEREEAIRIFQWILDEGRTQAHWQAFLQLSDLDPDSADVAQLRASYQAKVSRLRLDYD